MLDQITTSPSAIDEVVRVLRMLADPTRLRVLGMLRGGEMNVTTMCKKLKMAQPTVSHHLGLLRNVGLVQTRRDGKQIFYTLHEDVVSNVGSQGGMCIEAGPLHLHLLKNG